MNIKNHQVLEDILFLSSLLFLPYLKNSLGIFSNGCLYASYSLWMLSPLNCYSFSIVYLLSVPFNTLISMNFMI